MRKLQSTCYEMIKEQGIPGLKNEELTKNLKLRTEEMITKQLQELSPNQVKSIVQKMIDKYLGWIVFGAGYSEG